MGRFRASQGKGTDIVGYNVQIAVDTERHLIVAYEVTNVGPDLLPGWSSIGSRLGWTINFAVSYHTASARKLPLSAALLSAPLNANADHARVSPRQRYSPVRMTGDLPLLVNARGP